MERGKLACALIARLAIVCAIPRAAAAAPAVPGIVNFQGQLKTASGSVADGTHTARFTLYNGTAGNLTITGETGTFQINAREQVILILAHRNIEPVGLVVWRELSVSLSPGSAASS